jgi:hypothetical protein
MLGHFDRRDWVTYMIVFAVAIIVAIATVAIL